MAMNGFRLNTLLLVVALLAACSSTGSRIRDQQSAFDSYPAEVQQKIRAGQVDVGFTQEQVRLALGEPDRRYTQQTAKGESQVWAYSKSSSGISFGLGVGGIGASSGVGGGVGVSSNGGGSGDDKLRVTFDAGRVTVIERTQ